MVEEYAILVSYAPALSGTPSILAGESFLRSAMKNGGFHPRSVCYGMFRFHFPFVFNRNPIPVIPFVRSCIARCEMV